MSVCLWLVSFFALGGICDQMWYVSSSEDTVPSHASQGNPSHRWFWKRQEGTKQRLKYIGNNVLWLNMLTICFLFYKISM